VPPTQPHTHTHAPGERPLRRDALPERQQLRQRVAPYVPSYTTYRYDPSRSENQHLPLLLAVNASHQPFLNKSPTTHSVTTHRGGGSLGHRPDLPRRRCGGMPRAPSMALCGASPPRRHGEVCVPAPSSACRGGSLSRSTNHITTYTKHQAHHTREGSAIMTSPHGALRSREDAVSRNPTSAWGPTGHAMGLEWPCVVVSLDALMPVMLRTVSSLPVMCPSWLVYRKSSHVCIDICRKAGGCCKSHCHLPIGDVGAHATGPQRVRLCMLACRHGVLVRSCSAASPLAKL
jgi:hypothetical protein